MLVTLGETSAVAFRALIRRTCVSTFALRSRGIAANDGHIVVTVSAPGGCFTAPVAVDVVDCEEDYLLLGREFYGVLAAHNLAMSEFQSLPLYNGALSDDVEVNGRGDNLTRLGEGSTGVDAEGSSQVPENVVTPTSTRAPSFFEPTLRDGEVTAMDVDAGADTSPVVNSPVTGQFTNIFQSLSYLSDQYDGVEGYAYLKQVITGCRSTGIAACALTCSLSVLKAVLTMHGLSPHGLCLRDCQSMFFFHLMSGDCVDTRIQHGDRTACITMAKGFESASSFSSEAFLLLRTRDSDSIMKVLRLLNIETAFTPKNVRPQLLRFVRDLASEYAPAFSLFPNGAFLKNFDRASKPHLLAIAHTHFISVNRYTTSREELKNRIMGHFVSGQCYSHAARIKNKACIAVIEGERAAAPADKESENITSEEGCCLKWLSEHVHEFSLAVIQRVFSLLKIDEPCHSDLENWRAALRRYIRTQSSGPIRRRDPNLRRQSDQIQALWPVVPEQALKEKLIDEFRRATSSEALAQVVCASCSESFLKTSAVVVPDADVDFRCFLRPDRRPSHWDTEQESDLVADPTWIKFGYECPPYVQTIPDLPDVILDPRGVRAQENEDIYELTLCESCATYVRRKRVPPLALANHNFTGDVPQELTDLTPVEEALIARARVQKIVVHIKEDPTKKRPKPTYTGPSAQRHYKGHTILFPQKTTKLLGMLPPPIESVTENICILFVGAGKPSAEWIRENAKPLYVRRDVVTRALCWLKVHNPLYADVVINEDALLALPDNSPLHTHVEHVVPTHSSESLTSRYDNTDPDNYFQDGPRVGDRAGREYSAPFPTVAIADVNPDATASDLKRAAARHFQKKGRHLLVGHDIKPATEYFNPQLFPCIYPTLFPYGLGGFEIPQRSTPLSLHYQGSHIIRRADKLAQRHPAFMFTLFNLIQRRQMLLHTSLKIKKTNYHRVASAFAQISPSTVQSVAESVAKGKPRSDFNREEQQAFDLLREVNVVTSHVSGSSASRVALRNEIRAMMIEKGLPTFYITINPADTRNPIIRVLSGEDIDVDMLPESLLNSNFDQSVFIANNPAVGATFFDHYMQAFIRTLLNYNPDLRVQQPGVLGTVKSYFGCVEAQGRGSLHCHMLVWLEDACNIDEIKEKVLHTEDPSFKNQLLSYLDDCISSCHPPKADGYEDPTVHPSSIRPTADINTNSDSLTASAQNDVYHLVDALQMHEHNATCHKHCAPTDPNPTCRFELSESNVVPSSYIDSDTGDVHLRKLEGMVNNFNETILRAIRCNMDIKFIGSGPSAKAVLYYITDYVTKSQLETHVAYAALSSAIQKLGDYKPGEDDLMSRAKRLLQRCAYMMIKHQELSAQQVASYMMGLPDNYKSHQCEVLYWTSFESHIDMQHPSPDCYPSRHTGCTHIPTDENATNEDIAEEMMAESDRDTVDESSADEVSATQAHEAPSFDDNVDVAIESPTDNNLLPRTDRIKDYVYRSDALSRVCLWDFVAQFSKVKAKPKVTDTENCIYNVETDLFSVARRSQPTYSFFHEHPDHESHILKLRPFHERRHPNPLGPALPRRDMPEQVLRHSRLMLMLFKPWRDVSDLIQDHASWSDAYVFHRDQFSPRLRGFIDNMQLLHECKDSRDDHFAARLRQNRNSRSLHDDAASEQVMQDAILNHIDEVSNARSHNRSAAEVEADACVDAACRSGLFDDVEHDVHIEDFTHSSQGTNITHEPQSKEAIWRAQYDEHNKNWKSNLRQESLHNNRFDASATFEALNPAQSDHLTWNNQSTATESSNHLSVLDDASPGSNSNPVSIEDIISEFSLNLEQARAFRIIADHSNQPRPEQLRMFLGGAGGTGKSRVISALRAYFERNNNGRRFRLASYTGVAAKNIEGMTIHCALSLNQRHNNRLSQRAKDELIAFWEGVDYFLIDEVSMIGCRFLLKMNDALTDAKRCNQPFGGINIIFAGDFSQLAPVADRKLYTDVDSAAVGTARGLNVVMGKLLWSSVSTVVLLTEVMRQNATRDKDFVDLLGRLRMGCCTDADFRLLRTRLISNPNLDSDIKDWQDAPIIVSKNECKDCLNAKAVEDFASRTGQQMHYYYATDTCASQEITNHNLQNTLWKLCSNKCEQRLGRLPLVIGMPVMLSTNYEVSAGIVNGCSGKLIDIRYTVDNIGRRHAVSCIVECPSVTGSTVSDLPANAVACIQDKVKFSITHPDSGATCQVERTQVPILPAFAITAHKSQAQTMPKTTVDIESCYGSEAPYVMLSRVKSLDGLLILRQFRIKKIQCRPSPDIRKENRRLELLRLHTLTQHGNLEEKANAARILAQTLTSIEVLAPVPLSRDLPGSVGDQLNNLQNAMGSLCDLPPVAEDHTFSGATAAAQRTNKRKFADCS